MSRIGKKPVPVPKGVTATVAGKMVKVKGPKGELSFTLADLVSAKLENGEILVTPANDEKAARALWGMSRTMIVNMIEGVTNGYERSLELVGVGYRAQMQGAAIKLSLGLSHEVVYEPPKGVTLVTPKPTEIKITGVDKQAVGQVAAEIRRFRPPEPYKGKGVRYMGETLRRKEGKKK